jgi:hypothetical protein
MRDGGASEFDHIATYLAEDLAVVVQVEHGKQRPRARTPYRRRPSVSPASTDWKAVPGSLCIGTRIQSQRRNRTHFHTS